MRKAPEGLASALHLRTRASLRGHILAAHWGGGAGRNRSCRLRSQATFKAAPEPRAREACSQGWQQRHRGLGLEWPCRTELTCPSGRCRWQDLAPHPTAVCRPRLKHTRPALRLQSPPSPRGAPTYLERASALLPANSTPCPLLDPRDKHPSENKPGKRAKGPRVAGGTLGTWRTVRKQRSLPLTQGWPRPATPRPALWLPCLGFHSCSSFCKDVFQCLWSVRSPVRKPQQPGARGLYPGVPGCDTHQRVKPGLCFTLCASVSPWVQWGDTQRHGEQPTRCGRVWSTTPRALRDGATEGRQRRTEIVGPAGSPTNRATGMCSEPCRA